VNDPDKANPSVRGDGKRRVFGTKLAELPKDIDQSVKFGFFVGLGEQRD
jgi:hypothetical protein